MGSKYPKVGTVYLVWAQMQPPKVPDFVALMAVDTTKKMAELHKFSLEGAGGKQPPMPYVTQVWIEKTLSNHLYAERDQRLAARLRKIR